MGFWDRAKEQFKKDMQNAKDAAHTTELKLEYIGGMPGVKGKEIKISKHQQTGVTRINGNEVQLLGIDWQESAQRSAGKAAAGAIIGSVIAPGIGTIAGAALGGRRKDTSTAVISVQTQDQAYSVYVRCNEAEFKDLTALL
jgi:tryptophan synthase alpha subunit